MHIVHSPLRRFEYPVSEFNLNLHSTVGEQETRRIIRYQVHEGLLHPPQHAVAVDDITESSRAVDCILTVSTALLWDIRIIVIVRGWHRPFGYLFFRGVFQGKATVIPVSACTMGYISPLYAPIVHLYFALVLMQPRTCVFCTY